ncbi:MAG TPA: HWE histidine kinase domain-containing protein [Rhizomicrobium sp.]|nr:HWE histidine kinase domain-containing protein [Rhizomicrobium sp.]
MGSVGLELRTPRNVYITSELDRRPAKAVDNLQAKRALLDLAARMVDRPEEVLPRFVDLAMELTGGVSAGLSLYEENPAPGVFRWRYLRGTLSPFDGATTPRNFSPCGITLDQNRPVLSSHPERFYDWISDAGIVVPEVLLVPLYLGGAEPLGTLWIVSDIEGHFDSGHAQLATELASFAGIALRMLRSEQSLHKALEEQETLTREMGHRIKNLFAIAEGMVRITARNADSKEEMAKMLSGRFHALASAHGLVRRSFSTGEDTRITDLATLLRAIVEPHERLKRAAASKFAISGPVISCGQHAINGIALVFHELATNAAKYGALNDDGGHVTVTWDKVADDLVFRWVEKGGPEISATPQISGFGSKLLQDTVVRQFGGQFDHDWHPGGLAVTISLPVKCLAH